MFFIVQTLGVLILHENMNFQRFILMIYSEFTLVPSFLKIGLNLRMTFMVNRQRPINLDLSSIKQPPMAIASILHRISGIVLFLLLPFMLYLLDQSLQTAISFDALRIMLANPYYKFLLWGFSAALTYHVLAGIRHLLMDMGFGENINAGRCSAMIVIALAIILTIVLGVCIW